MTPQDNPALPPDFRVLFESIPGLFMVLAPDSPRFTILAASDAYLRASKKRREEIIGRPVFEVFPDNPDDPSGVEVNSRASFERVLRRRLPDAQAMQQHDIRRHQEEDGGFESRFWNPLNTPVLDKHGQVRYIIHRVEDVTDLVRAQSDAGHPGTVDMEAQALSASTIARIRREAESAREREEQSAVIFNNIPIGMALAKLPERSFLAVNDAFLRMFGYSRDEVLGRTGVDLGISDDESQARVMEQLQQHGPVRGLEIAGKTKGGDQLVLSFNLDWVSIGGERLLLSTIQDITERKRGEEALRASERRLIGVLESMPDAFASFDADMRYTYVNANAERLQAARREELLGKDVRVVYPDAESYKTISQYERVIREQRPLTSMSYHAGFKRWVEIRAFPTPAGVSVFYKDVSAQVTAEEALRRSEARWNAAIENFAEGAIIATEDEQVIYWNPAARAMHGFTRPDEGIEPLEKTPITFQLWTPDGSHMLELDEWPMRRIKRGESVRNLELRIRRPDQGWEKVFSYSGEMVETAGGEWLIFLSCYDLTELRRAEQALRESEARFRLALKNAPVSVAVQDRDLRYVWTYNQRSARPDQIIGHFDHEIFTADEAAHITAIKRRVLEEGIEQRQQMWLDRPTGKMYLDICWEPIRDEAGRIVGVASATVDLTPIKLAEEALQQANAELRDSRAAALNLMEDADNARRRAEEAADSLRQAQIDLDRAQEVGQIGSWRLDVRRNILTWSDENHRIFGVPKGTSLTYEVFLSFVHPDDRRYVDAKWQAGLRGEPYDIEHRIVANERVKWVREKAYLEFNKSGELLGGFGITQDITERKRAEEELRKSRDELEVRVQERTADLARANKELREEIVKREKAEQQLLQAQKLESIGTLTGGIAHDFNNILGAIVINSEMAILDLPPGSHVRNNLELILKSGERGRDLVRQMLLFSRKSEKKQEILALTPPIKETFKLLRSSIPTTIQMKLHLETESDTVYADPSQVQQVIMNLCTNAAHAMRGTTGSIDISLQGITFGSMDVPEADMEAGDYLVLSVKDTGCGMDEEVRKRVFEPFFTTKPVGEGTGLGLSVVYGIVKSHRGHITVYSEPGRGSIFKVYLPKAETRVLEKAEAPKPIPKGKERILFVDDEEIIVRSMRNMLERLGYKVTTVTDSEDALKLFSEKPSEFDLVMTDQTMPSVTGEDLGKELMRIRPDIPIILCTGYSDLVSSEKAAAKGFRGFIMKPFTLRESAELVRRVLDENKKE